jgi:hypothetical protein
MAFSDEEQEEEVEEVDAYVSDDDQVRSLLQDEDLLSSDDDQERGRQQQGQRKGQQGQPSFQMKAATGQEMESAVRYRNIVESRRHPGTFHVFVPLPTYRYVLKKKLGAAYNTDGDPNEYFHYVKRRNMEKLTEKFSSIQDAALAYDACVRRLYAYGGFSFSTKQASNEWQFAPDHVPTKKRSLRVFSHIRSEQQSAATEDYYVDSDDDCEDAGAGAGTGAGAGGSDERGKADGDGGCTTGGRGQRRAQERGQRVRMSKLRVQAALTPQQLDDSYRIYIEQALQRVGPAHAPNSFAAWRRRSSLLDAATAVTSGAVPVAATAGVVEDTEKNNEEEEEEVAVGDFDAHCSKIVGV